MSRLTSWRLICIYVAGDACLNVASRVFQVCNAWYFLKVTSRPDRLSLTLLVVWSTSTALLPAAGVLSERFRKSRILLAMAGLTAVASVIGLAAPLVLATDSRTDDWLFCVSLACGLCLSTANAFISPLGTPLLARVASDQAEVHRAMRIKSSMFIVNLLLGPTLAGAAIGQFGAASAGRRSLDRRGSGVARGVLP